MKMFLTVCNPSWPSTISTNAVPGFEVKVYPHQFTGLPVWFWEVLKNTHMHTWTLHLLKNKKNIISYWILFMWEIPWNLSCRNINFSKTKTKIPTRSYIYYKHRHIYFLFVYKTTVVLLYQNILYARVNEMSLFLHFSIIFINSKWKLLQIVCHGLCIFFKKQ